MSSRLHGKVAIVTGGANGIGRATAELFLSEGAQVVISDIQDDVGAAFAAKHSGNLRYIHADVSKEEDVEELVANTVKHFGQLDVMFNNAAASGDRAPIIELTSEGLSETLTLVAGSVMAGHKYAARQFITQGTGGSIISTSSVASYQGAWGPAGYTAAKHAVMGIVRAATIELAPLGIRSNAIAPGAITTPGSARVFNVAEERAFEFVEFMNSRTATLQPVPRAGRASDVAKAALFLAGDESEWICGTTIVVDGGATAIAMGGPAPMVLPGSVSAVSTVASEFFADL